MTAKMLAGNNMESRLNIPMEIRLKQDNDTAIEISQPFEVYGRIETITGVSSVDENTEGLTVAFYKDGAAAELKEGLFPGEGEYLIQYTYESEHNRCYAYEIITVTEKKVTTISVEGNYAKIYEVGESFDVTGLMLVVNYTIGESEKIPLTQEMVTLDTSVPGEDILLTFRYEGAELVDLVTVTEKTYTISGKVTLGGTALSGITVGYGENAECTTDAEGNFSFRVEAGANIILTVEESDTYKAFSLEIGAISEDTVRNIELKEKSGQTQPPQEPAGTEGGCQGCGGILKAETGIVFALAVIAAGICLFVKKKRS